ncbi:MAG: cupin domain-containing protein [Anaerolineales bacterium]|jgi:quercetin dioxygenase-like cupin family protein
MAVQRYTEMKVDLIREGAERRLGHTDNLMMVIIDFDDGPQSEPDPPHAHPHEQVSYVAKGEIFFFIDDECERLGPGDMFLAPPDKPHSIQLLTKHVRLVDCFTPIREDFLD